MTNFQVFEWPDREEARQLWQKNSREKGAGCFLINAPSNDTAVAVGVPIWATKKALKGLPAVLYQDTIWAIRDAGLGADRAILVILNYPVFQIIKIPFDPTEQCELIFEATAQ